MDLGRGPTLVGINTSIPNGAVAAAIETGFVPSLANDSTLGREVHYGRDGRIDILLQHADRPPCYVEIKNVHLMRQVGLAEFPDSVTTRDARHLHALASMVETGARAVMVYFVQRGDAERVALAQDIDSAYAHAFIAARAKGVEAIALRADVTIQGIGLPRIIPLELPSEER